jgi:hypothetical protein
MSIDGNIDLGDLTGEDSAFLLEGMFEAAMPLPLYSLEADGATGQILEPLPSVLELPAFAASAGTADGMVLPQLGLLALGSAGQAGRATLSLPAFSAAGAIDPPLALPQVQLDASGTAGALSRPGYLALAPFTLSGLAIDHAELALSEFQLAASALPGTLGQGRVALSSWDLVAEAHRDASGDAVLSLPLPQLQASASSDAVIGATIILDQMTLRGVATAGTVAQATLTVPLYVSTADAASYGDPIGNATLLVPAFSASASTVTLARPHTVAIMLNTRLKGVTRYDGLAANSFARFANLTLAASADGIVALMGDTDVGAPIEAGIVAGTSDMGQASRKRIEAAYVGYRSDNEMELTLITDEHHEYTYRLTPRQQGDRLHGTRVKFGRGVDGRYWQWKLANTAGAKFELASIDLNVAPLARSV